MVRASRSAVTVSCTIDPNSVSAVQDGSGSLGGKVPSAAAGFRLGLWGCKIVSVAVAVETRRVMHVIVGIPAWATPLAAGSSYPCKVGVVAPMIGAGQEDVS